MKKSYDTLSDSRERSIEFDRARKEASMIGDHEIDRVKAENSPIEVAARYGLELRRQGSDHVALCPFHSEKSPSFHIYADHFHCFGCGWPGDKPGDVIRFVEAIEGIDFKAACERLGAREDETPESAERRAQRAKERAQRQAEAEEQERLKKARQREQWPQLYRGRTCDLEEIATLRAIDYAGPWLAQELGYLRFCAYPPMDARNPAADDGPHRLMWVIGDQSCLQIRRLDGGKIQGIGKTQNLPGSVMHPIGLTGGDKPVIVTEGGPDYLTALARLYATGKDEEHEAICMLGAGQRFREQATKLSGRDVTIYAHHDERGQGLVAARAWAEEARDAGAGRVAIVEPNKPGDLNDIAE